MDARLQELVAAIATERCSIPRCGRPAAAVVEPEAGRLVYFCEAHAERAARFRVPAFQQDEGSGIRSFVPAEDGSRSDWEKKWSSADFTPGWETPSIPAEVREAAKEGWFPPGGRVLDIGCGSGEIAAWLSQQGCNVLGVDFSETAIAKAKAAHEGLPGLEFEVLDIRRAAPGRGGFDALLDRGCLQHVREKDAADYVRNVAAAAKPGAHFLLLLPAPPWRKDDWVRYLEDLLRPTFEIVRTTDAVAERQPTKSPARERNMVAFWMIHR